MGEGGEDVKLPETVAKFLGLSFECKNAENFTPVYRAFDQCVENMNRSKVRGRQPVVVIKSNRKEPLAIIPATFFIELLEKWTGCQAK